MICKNIPMLQQLDYSPNLSLYDFWLFSEFIETMTGKPSGTDEDIFFKHDMVSAGGRKENFHNISNSCRSTGKCVCVRARVCVWGGGGGAEISTKKGTDDAKGILSFATLFNQPLYLALGFNRLNYLYIYFSNI
jgi:hypothetical protein